MAAGTLDIVIEQGTTFKKHLEWVDDQVPPVAIDITGYTARMHLREELEDPDPPIIELTDGNGRITLGGVTGTIDLFIDDADTEALTIESGVYDLEVEAPGGDVTRLLEGKFKLSLEVTR
jgi:hypothetical protein